MVQKPRVWEVEAHRKAKGIVILATNGEKETPASAIKGLFQSMGLNATVIATVTKARPGHRPFITVEGGTVILIGSK